MEIPVTVDSFHAEPVEQKKRLPISLSREQGAAAILSSPTRIARAVALSKRTRAAGCNRQRAAALVCRTPGKDELIFVVGLLSEYIRPSLLFLHEARLLELSIGRGIRKREFMAA